LDALGLAYTDLCKLHRDSGTKEVFLTALKDKGVRSKLLREKMLKALGPFCWTATSEEEAKEALTFLPQTWPPTGCLRWPLLMPNTKTGSFKSPCICRRFHTSLSGLHGSRGRAF